MKLTKEEIKKKSFYLVSSGFQVMPPAHYSLWQTVTDKEAVMIDDKIYCTEAWKNDLYKRAGLQ
jgi:hypothetical protein